MSTENGEYSSNSLYLSSILKIPNADGGAPQIIPKKKRAEE